MSLLSLNDDNSQKLPVFNGSKNIVFEPPSLNSMDTNDKTEGYTKYVYSHGNTKLNTSIDSLTKKKSASKNRLEKIVYENDLNINADAINKLLSAEENASNMDLAEILFAVELLKNINLEIEKTDEEINKYNAIKDKLEKAINDLLE